MSALEQRDPVPSTGARIDSLAPKKAENQVQINAAFGNTRTRDMEGAPQRASATEGRLASALKGAGEVVKRWGTQMLIAIDGYRISNITKELGVQSEELGVAKAGGDLKEVARLMAAQAGALSEAERLSTRRASNAEKIKMHYDARLKEPKSKIESGSKELEGLKARVASVESNIKNYEAEAHDLTEGFQRLMASSQVDLVKKAEGAARMAAQMEKVRRQIEAEKQRLENFKNVTSSVQGRVDALNTEHGSQLSRLAKYTGIARDGRSGTEAARLKEKQEVATQARRADSGTTLRSEMAPTASRPEVAAANDNFTDEELIAALQELLDGDLRTRLEGIVLSKGSQEMVSQKVAAQTLAELWKQARESDSSVLKIPDNAVKNIGTEPMTIVEFGIRLRSDNSGSLSRSAIEAGVAAIAQRWRSSLLETRRKAA